MSLLPIVQYPIRVLCFLKSRQALRSSMFMFMFMLMNFSDMVID
ncbi:hypothetical protein V6Z12_D01G200800 [Gossypium hirsutum]